MLRGTWSEKNWEGLVYMVISVPLFTVRHYFKNPQRADLAADLSLSVTIRTIFIQLLPSDYATAMGANRLSWNKEPY